MANYKFTEYVDSEWVEITLIVDNDGYLYVNAENFNSAISYSMLQVVVENPDTGEVFADDLGFDSVIGGFDGELNIKLLPDIVYEVYFNIEREYDGSIHTTARYLIELSNGKPTSFKWAIAKVSGQPLRVSASEWNAFTKKINEFLKYKGKATINFTSAVSAGLPQGAVVGGNHGLSNGKVISASIINEAVRALKSMGASVSEVASNQPITADFFNDIVTKLNSIT